MKKILGTVAAVAVVTVMSFSVQAQDSGDMQKVATSTFNFGGSSIDAKAGECYGQVTIPAVKKTENKKLLVTPERKVVSKIIPAEYKNVTETIVVKEASESFKTIPATYKTVTEEIVVKPASKEIETVPAKYEEKQVRVMVKPAHTVWKKGTSSSITKVNDRGEVMCLVEVPAEYKVMKKRELVTPETTKEKVIPAVTKTITKQVIATPARVEKVAVPAQTKQIAKRVLVKPKEVVYATKPAEYKPVSREIIVTAEKTEWTKILCQTNAVPANVKRLQSALKSAGFDPGAIDGVLGYGTYKAVDAFQRAKGLSRGEITIDTLSALGVSI